MGYNEINFFGDDRHVLVDAIDVEGFKMVFRVGFSAESGLHLTDNPCGDMYQHPLVMIFSLDELPRRSVTLCFAR